ncbi:hypothetical protein J8M20_14090 [Pseudoalteromonas luteoviolacea]|uniref:hypothetical protein n=1 Tax=Pseudoalteromonas luteoviolacea TaxID=43657 RepID=UPI001B385A1F|nr:hypothetical protein [Pseudoalteromonas luteoviolacea]MBQ4812483.1 hypothetical protein [Pseudoalteromonas luteoviolacea]
MSMDIAVWVTCIATLPGDLPKSHEWNVEKWEDSTSYVYPSPNMDWQLIIEKLNALEKPTSKALKLNSDVKYGYVFSLEPIGADDTGYKMLEESIQSIANKCGGAVIEAPTGISKIDVQGS